LDIAGATAGPNSATADHGTATKAAAVRTALPRRDLLDIAEQYDRLPIRAKTTKAHAAGPTQDVSSKYAAINPKAQTTEMARMMATRRRSLI
jgi:hypothetical protein